MGGKQAHLEGINSCCYPRGHILLHIGTPRGHLLIFCYVGEPIRHCITYSLLEGHPEGTSSHFLAYSGTLYGTASHIIYRKGSLESTSSFFLTCREPYRILHHIIYWKGTLEGTSSCFLTCSEPYRALHHIFSTGSAH